MNEKLTINDVGLALKTLSFSPYVSSLDSFGIHLDGQNYEVYAGALPMVYIEGARPMDWFALGESYRYMSMAMNTMNAQRNGVTMYLKPGWEEFFFRIGFYADTFESFREGFERQLARFDSIADEFGRALDLAAQHLAEQETHKVCTTEPEPCKRTIIS